MACGSIADAKISNVTKNLIMGTKYRYDVTIEATIIPPSVTVVSTAVSATLKKCNISGVGGEVQVAGPIQLDPDGAGTTYSKVVQFQALQNDMNNMVLLAYVTASWQLTSSDNDRTAPWKL